MSALTALTLAFAYAAPDPADGAQPDVAGVRLPGPPQVAAGRRTPRSKTFTPSGDLECDVCIVGSGAGGGLIAGVLAQAGHDVVVLEAGGSHNEADFSGLELPAFQQMFWRGGPTPTADFNVNLLAALDARRRPDGQLVQLPAHARRGCASSGRTSSASTGVDGPEFDRHLDAVWSRLGVNDRLLGPQRSAPAHARRRSGAELVVQDSSAATRTRPRYSPESAGHIGFGDRTGAKRDVRQTYLHDASRPAPA